MEPFLRGGRMKRPRKKNNRSTCALPLGKSKGDASDQQAAMDGDKGDKVSESQGGEENEDSFASLFGFNR
jgi:hypothetical protein